MAFEGDPFAFYGRNIIQDYHAQLKARVSLQVEASQTAFSDVSVDQPPFPGAKVGILGAGIGGLYTALILDSLDIDYEILEASDRSGGRMCTYKFPSGDKYDYYDAGAMRFPFPKKDSKGRYKNGIMKRLAELTEYEPLNEGQDRLRNSVIPFYYNAREGSKPGFYYINGIREPFSNVPRGSFGAEELGVDAEYIRAGADAILGDVALPFVRMLVQDIETGNRKGWEVLMANDSYSTRAYMATKYLPSAHLELPPQYLPTNVINWCSQFSGSFDGALVETIFSLSAHTNIGNTDYGDVQWKSFEGGSETLPKKIEEYLNKKGSCVRFDKRVTAVSQGHMFIEIPINSPDEELPTDEEELLEGFVDLGLGEDNITNRPSGPTKRIKTPSVTITVNGNERHEFSHAISTLPLPVLSTVDLSDAGLNAMQMSALHALQYSTATKIAVLFKSNWWTTKLGIVGGQTFTDLPISMIVYPSHGVDSRTPSKVLIASYAVRAYADRLGALATAQDQEVLKELVLRNLAEAHNGLHPDVTYEFLREEFVDMHVKDWGRNEYAMGSYAFFGPGEFQDLYTSLTYPAAGKRLHFAGEAVSARHGWIVGALDSSWRAVYEYLKVTGQVEKIKKFKALWGENTEWSSTSPSVEAAQGAQRPDLLDEHLGLVDSAIQNRVIPLFRQSK